ncbi:hypothetical protein [Tistlia consotensis]|uniref:hypothetical protein n=1 Tax=Tistlia consotensis TaxID=1321365 RepID=UPI0011807BA0|nr:hypothetical protein [Tistlia consotensis]
MLRYLLLGLVLTALWLLVALGLLPNGLRNVEEFGLSGWPALGLLFLVPIMLIWMVLWLIRLQRRVLRLQELIFEYGAGPVQAPSYPLQRARERAQGGVQMPPAEPWQEDALTEAWRETPEPEPEERPAAPPARAPKRVAFSTLDPLPPESTRPGWPDPEQPAYHTPASAAPQAYASAGAAARERHAAFDARRGQEDWHARRAPNGQEGSAARPEPPPAGPRPVDAPPRAVPSRAPEAAPAQPPRARLPEPDPGDHDTSPEPLSDELEPHRPPRAAPNAPRLEALSPTYRPPSEVPNKALSPEQLADYESRVERELNAIAMDLASILSSPQDYDRALAALNGGADEAFFQLLARDFQAADRAALRQQLAMVGGDAALETYLEKYEQLLVVAYRSDPGGSDVRRLVESAMGRLHQAIETYRQDTAHG